jgi:hypothetical protein
MVATRVMKTERRKVTKYIVPGTLQSESMVVTRVMRMVRRKVLKYIVPGTLQSRRAWWSQG